MLADRFLVGKTWRRHLLDQHARTDSAAHRRARRLATAHGILCVIVLVLLSEQRIEDQRHRQQGQHAAALGLLQRAGERLQRVAIVGGGTRLPGLHLRHDSTAPRSHERQWPYRQETAHQRLRPQHPQLQRQTSLGHRTIKRLQEHRLNDHRQGRYRITLEYQKPLPQDWQTHLPLLLLFINVFDQLCVERLIRHHPSHHN